MKRDIFSELAKGFDALAAERHGNVTLLSHKRNAAKYSRPSPRNHASLPCAKILAIFVQNIGEK